MATKIKRTAQTVLFKFYTSGMRLVYIPEYPCSKRIDSSLSSYILAVAGFLSLGIEQAQRQRGAGRTRGRSRRYREIGATEFAPCFQATIVDKGNPFLLPYSF